MRLVVSDSKQVFCPRRLGVLLWEARLAGLSACDRVNALVREFGEAGLLRDTLVLGPVVLERSYGNVVGCENEHSHEVIQAALSSELGLAAVVWDSDAFLVANYDPPAALLEIANEHMIPLEETSAAIQLLVGRHADEMLERLVSNVVVHQGSPRQSRCQDSGNAAE